MRLRRATASDRAFILELVPRFVESGVPPWRTREEMVDGTRAQLDAAIGRVDDASFVTVAETDDGELLGFAWTILETDFYTGRATARISEIAVVRNGTGAGALLMNACEAWARERDIDLMTLNALESNEHARQFYRALGYEPEYTHYAKRLRE